MSLVLLQITKRKYKNRSIYSNKGVLRRWFKSMILKREREGETRIHIYNILYTYILNKYLCFLINIK